MIYIIYIIHMIYIINIIHVMYIMNFDPPNEVDEVTLRLWDVLPGLERVELAHQLGQAVGGDGAQHFFLAIL